MKQDELDGDSKFSSTIGLGGKSTSYWKTYRIQSLKWRGVCMAYKNAISKCDVGQTNFNDIKKTYMA